MMHIDFIEKVRAEPGLGFMEEPGETEEKFIVHSAICATDFHLSLEYVKTRTWPELAAFMGIIPVEEVESEKEDGDNGDTSGSEDGDV